MSGEVGHAVAPTPTVPTLPPIYVTSGSGKFDPYGPNQEASLSLPAGDYLIFAPSEYHADAGLASPRRGVPDF